jgi:(2R)-3-sulfolactate dehydrogenase (NADP+)
MLEDPGVRLPGARREALAARAQAMGVALSDSLFAQLQSLAG